METNKPYREKGNKEKAFLTAKAITKRLTRTRDDSEITLAMARKLVTYLEAHKLDEDTENAHHTMTGD